MTTSPDRALSCPSCGAPEPRLHPAVSGGGEVTRICLDPWHGRVYCTKPGQHMPGQHDASCVPPADPRNAELRLLRAIFGLCAICDNPEAHHHTDTEYEEATNGTPL